MTAHGGDRKRRFLRVGWPVGIAVSGLVAVLLYQFGHWPENVAVGVPSGAAVVIDGQTFDRQDLESYAGESAPFGSRAAAEELMKGFISHILLQGEARRRGEPELTPTEMLARLIEEIARDGDVREAAIEAFYREHIDRYVSSRSVRLAYFAVPRRGELEKEQEAIRELYLLAQLNRRPTSFGKLVDRPIPGATARQGVLVSCGGTPDAVLPASVVDHACDEMAKNAISAPLESSDAWFVIRKTAEYPAQHVSLRQARLEIRDKLRSEARRAAKRDALARLVASARIEFAPGLMKRLTESSPVIEVEYEGPPAVPGMGQG